MTGEQKIEVAARAVACKGWRWLPGMLEFGTAARCVDGSDPADLADGERHMVRWTKRHGITDYQYVEPDTLPDFDDPATLGCLLALVRKAWGDANGQFEIHIGLGHELILVIWRDADGDGDELEFDLLAEALVAALEAAPG